MKAITVFKRYKKLISLSLFFIFILLIAYYIIKNLQDFLALTLVNPLMIVLIFVASLIRLFATGMVMDTAIRPLGVNLSTTESFGLATLTRLVNQVAPGKVGLVMRSVYLKKKYEFDYSSFVSSLAATHVVLYLVSSIIGLFSIQILYFIGVDISTIFSYILFFVAIILMLILTIPDIFRDKIKSKAIQKAVTGWHDIRKNKSNIFALYSWSILFVLSSAAIMYSSFNTLGVNIGIWVALFFSSIYVVNAVIAITPSGFGISEGIIVIVAHAVGIDTTTALAAALLQRIVIFFSVLLIAPFFSRRLFNASPWHLIKLI